MHTEGNEVHETTDEARAGSTPNLVRWVLAISLLGAIVLLSIIWMTGAAVTDGADDTNNATDRMAQEADQLPGNTTDSRTIAPSRLIARTQRTMLGVDPARASSTSA